MQSLKTVLLRHQLRGGNHYDWMLETPGGQRGPDADRLLTWRLPLPSWMWPQRVMAMEELIAHRRVYLRRSGAIGGRRGTVQQIDRGTAIVHQWHEDGGYFELRLRHFQGLVQISRGPALRWRMRTLRDAQPACHR
ncbi:MAG: hypothetical protein WD294_10490 [Phycisphaeraceae bacterium]